MEDGSQPEREIRGAMQISTPSRWLNLDSQQRDFSLNYSFDEVSPWNRCGLPEPEPANPPSSRLSQGAFFVSAWLVMPLAVLTCHGWVGLLVHALALSGATGLLQTATIQTRTRLQHVVGLEGDGVCASVTERI
jgi:hypothetical protein